jgi:hypothetical protein
VTLGGRFFLGGGDMKILAANAALIPTDAEHPEQRKHHGRLAGAIGADEGGQLRAKTHRLRIRPEATEIGEGQALKLHEDLFPRKGATPPALTILASDRKVRNGKRAMPAGRMRRAVSTGLPSKHFWHQSRQKSLNRFDANACTRPPPSPWRWPPSCRSRRRLVSNSANTPSMSKKHLPPAVPVSIDCSVAFRTAPRARTVRSIRDRDEVAA